MRTVAWNLAVSRPAASAPPPGRWSARGALPTCRTSRPTTSRWSRRSGRCPPTSGAPSSCTTSPTDRPTAQQFVDAYEPGVVGIATVRTYCLD